MNNPRETSSTPQDLERDGRPPRSAAPERIVSSRIFNGRREIEIEHAGRVYRLRITQNDKLILTA